MQLTELRKLITPREVEFDMNVMVEILREMHPVYGFQPDAYRFAGISHEALLAAGIIEKMPAKRGPKPKAKPKKKGRKEAKKR